MKWSQAICVSILADGLYPVPIVDGLKPRFGHGLSATALAPTRPHNLLAPNWEPFAETVDLALLEQEDGGQGTGIST
jgi:hypothetical protein